MMGRSRADVVMVMDNAICGLEIKSDADTYARLSRQIKDYDKYYDYNIAVVGTKHAGSIKEHIPEWWGVITVEEVNGILDFYFFRKPQKNPKVNMKNKIAILWRPELAHIQELNGMFRYTDKSKRFVTEKILATVPAEVLDKQISEELFERDYTKIEETLNEFRKRNQGSRKNVRH